MNTVLESLLQEATTLEEYEAILEMFGETDAPQWKGLKTRKREERREVCRVLPQPNSEGDVELDNGLGRLQPKKSINTIGGQL